MSAEELGPLSERMEGATGAAIELLIQDARRRATKARIHERGGF